MDYVIDIRREDFDSQEEYRKEYGRLYREKHKEKFKAYSKEWQQNNREHVNKKSKETYQRRKKKRKEYNQRPEIQLKRREWHLQHYYGLTIEQYEGLLEEQNYRCAICRTNEPGGQFNRWHVDHCHKTEKVRGLLCNKCNGGLALFDDNIDSLIQAIRYLKDG